MGNKYVIVGKSNKFAVIVFGRHEIKCSYERPPWLLKKAIDFYNGTIANSFCEASMSNIFLFYYMLRRSMKKEGYSWDQCSNQEEVLNKINAL